MATSLELVQWALANAGQLQLQLENLKWIGEIFPDLTDVSVRITCGGNTHTGYGFAAEKDMALIKGFAEAAERAVVSEKRLATSSGVAAHLNLDDAIHCAREELIERDLILCHFYCERAYRTIPIPRELSAMARWYRSQAIEFSLYELGEGGVLFAAFGAGAARPFGLVLGAARKSTAVASIFSAAIEASRQVSHLMLASDPTPSLTLEEFLAKADHDFSDHGQLALDLKYYRKIQKLFDSGSARFEVPLPAKSEIIVEEVITNIPELYGCPLRYARAHSDRVQELFLGPPMRQLLNMRRLEEFTGFPVEFEQLSSLPHPFN